METGQSLTKARDKLISLLTDYDTKQSKKPGYNIHALPQYYGSVDSAYEDVAKNGLRWEIALEKVFTMNQDGTFYLYPVRQFVRWLNK